MGGEVRSINRYALRFLHFRRIFHSGPLSYDAVYMNIPHHVGTMQSWKLGGLQAPSLTQLPTAWSMRDAVHA